MVGVKVKFPFNTFVSPPYYSGVLRKLCTPTYTLHIDVIDSVTNRNDIQPIPLVTFQNIATVMQLQQQHSDIGYYSKFQIELGQQHYIGDL